MISCLPCLPCRLFVYPHILYIYIIVYNILLIVLLIVFPTSSNLHMPIFLSCQYVIFVVSCLAHLIVELSVDVIVELSVDVIVELSFDFPFETREGPTFGLHRYCMISSY